MVKTIFHQELRSAIDADDLTVVEALQTEHPSRFTRLGRSTSTTRRSRTGAGAGA